MKRAQKIYEAHVYTVSAHSDPMVRAIQSDLFPIIENYLAQKDMITESTDTLSWEQIIGVFKAAEKLTGGGVLQRASKATSSFKNAVQGKVSEILSKYQSNAPVENADVKVDKLSNKAMQAIEANVPPEEQSDSKYAIKRLRMLSRKMPEAVSAVIGLLSTVLSYANSEKAAELIPALASSGADAIEDTDYERMDPVVGDLNDIDTDDDADTMPRMPTFSKSVNKDDRRAKKGDRKQGVTKQSSQGGLYAPSVNEFKKSWDKSGRPRTVDGLAQVLRDAGLSEEQMEQVFESQGLKYQSPLKYPEPEEPQQEQPQPEEKIPVPIGFKVTSKTGNEVVWKGAQWVSKGRPIKREYVPKVEAAAQYALKKQLAQKKKDEEEAQRKKDSEYDFEHEDYEMQDVPADSPEQKVQAMQSKAKGEQPGKPDETLKRIAAVMKALGMTAADL